MRISSAYPSDYLKAADLLGHSVNVTLSHVEMRELNNESKPILFFQGKQKGMVLNKTNANKIAELFGDDTDDWTGQEVTIFEALVEFQGRTVPALRVRPAKPQPQRKRQTIDEPPDHPGQLEQSAPPSGAMVRNPKAKQTSEEIIDDDIPF